jgi:prepilin-type N-terminal cleavage/methylation domain-containing protein/prepilin-type processing-associated H-X9-DG protein
MHRGFTLIELLVVIAIIAILAAILFPVFAQAKEAAKKTKAISNMKQADLAGQMYMNDYDDAYMLSDSGGSFPGWGYGPPDTVPFQTMYPYMKNMEIDVDPMDPWQSLDDRITDQCRYMGCTSVNDATDDEKMYARGVRSNIGYNFAFFSPWIYKYGVTPNYFGSATVTANQISNPAHTLQFATSIWLRTPGGTPTGGGNWVVQTPCWLDTTGNLMAPMSGYTDAYGAGKAFSYNNGWYPDPLSWNVYGGVWPYYNQTSSTAAAGAQNGRAIIGWADGHVTNLSISAIAAGCSAYGVGVQQGQVTDPTKFIWAAQQP